MEWLDMFVVTKSMFSGRIG